MVCKLTDVLSSIVQRFGRWRLFFLIFLIAYSTLLMLSFDYAAIQWDETPHLVGGLLLSRGEIQEYAQRYLYYPPLFDATTALYYLIFGASVFTVRLVALSFGMLSVWVVFEFANRFYGPKTALLSSVLLASMPGFIFLCRLAFIETMLLFFFSISIFLFFSWMRTNNNKLLLLSGVTLGLGFIAKYQVLVAGIVILVSLLLMHREPLLTKIGKFLAIAIIAVAVVLPVIVGIYQQHFLENLGEWFYAIQIGNEARTSYSERFFFPIFYLIEMTYPYVHIHPISLPLYILSLFGLGFLFWRRRREDKFSLIWFFVVYGAFTLIPNKSWRYVIPAFPILAVSASEFILFIWNRLKQGLTLSETKLFRMSISKIAAILFLLLLGVSFVYSWWDAYCWVEFDRAYIPIEEAAQYVIENSTSNETTVVLFTANFFSTEMVKFYLDLNDSGERELWPYPEKPADAYKPDFNLTFLIERCEASNVKLLLLYEHGNIEFYESHLRSHDVLGTMVDTDKFVFEKEIGTFPRRIFVLRFRKVVSDQGDAGV
ncbi:MAG: glycosyltransferase family 39 protein [Candidatus Bathyarchaeota archaeon]|nr:glycosyltransferase family 39 protein [Candidatus Bathyarchaeota archaeon]